MPAHEFAIFTFRHGGKECHAPSGISSKGQITIPIEVRKDLGAKSGDRVEVVKEEGKYVLRLMHPDESPFTKFIGCLPAFKSTEEVVAYWRDLRDPDGEYM